MTPQARLNGPAPRRRMLRVALLLAVCMFATSHRAGAEPQAPPPQVPAASKTTAGPAARAAEDRPVAPAPPPAASQPAPARVNAGEGPIRRDTPRADTPRGGASTAPAAAAKATGLNLPRLLGALTLVLGLIFALRWVLRRAAHPGLLPGATNAVQVLTRSPLSPRQQLLLVRVGRRLLVVADCNGQLNSLSEITDADEVAALVGQLRDEKLTVASKSFGNLLGMWRRGSEAAGGDDDSLAADRDEFPRAAPDVPARRHAGGDCEDADPDGGDGTDDDPAVSLARGEINGLMERVRLISHQFKR